MDLDYKEFHAAEEEEIRKKEPELLVQFVSKQSEHITNGFGVTLPPADKIAYAITHITALYADAIKRARGGWTCGTCTNKSRTSLSLTISAKYSEEELQRFIEFCVSCNDDRILIQSADNNNKDMINDFLAMRPEPFVHPPEYLIRQILEGKN